MSDGSRISVDADHHESLASRERDRTLWSIRENEFGAAMSPILLCLWVHGAGLI